MADRGPRHPPRVGRRLLHGQRRGIPRHLLRHPDPQRRPADDQPDCAVGQLHALPAGGVRHRRRGARAGGRGAGLSRDPAGAGLVDHHRARRHGRGAAHHRHRRRRSPSRGDREHLRPQAPHRAHQRRRTAGPGRDRRRHPPGRPAPAPDQRARRPDRPGPARRRRPDRPAGRPDQPVPHRLRRAPGAAGAHAGRRSGGHPRERRPRAGHAGPQRPHEPARPDGPLRGGGLPARRRAGPGPGSARHPHPHQGGRRGRERAPRAGRDPLPAPPSPPRAHQRHPARVAVRRGVPQPALDPGLRPRDRPRAPRRRRGRSGRPARAGHRRRTDRDPGDLLRALRGQDHHHRQPGGQLRGDRPQRARAGLRLPPAPPPPDLRHPGDPRAGRHVRGPRPIRRRPRGPLCHLGRRCPPRARGHADRQPRPPVHPGPHPGRGVAPPGRRRAGRHAALPRGQRRRPS